MTSRALLNFQDTNSDGYLTLQIHVAPEYTWSRRRPTSALNWTLTLFANFNGLFQNLNDNAGETAAQVNAFGERYARCRTPPAQAGHLRAL